VRAAGDPSVVSLAAGVPALGRPHFGAWSPGVSVAFEHFRPV